MGHGDGNDDQHQDADGDGEVDNVIGGTGGAPGTGETDPNDPDTDADGLDDGAELADGDPLVLDGTDSSPVDSDTDDGGVADGPAQIATENGWSTAVWRQGSKVCLLATNNTDTTELRKQSEKIPLI